MISGYSGDDLRIIAIDPGTNKCGFTVLSLNIETKEIKVLTAYTVSGNSFITQNKMFAALHGDKAAKLKGYQMHLKELCERVEPYMVGSEAPYMGRFAAAFGALKEMTTVLRLAANSYDFTMPFLFIEPTPVKKFMGVQGKKNMGNKDAMTEKLQERKDVVWPEDLTIDMLDEHCVDSTCVGLYFIDQILQIID